MSVLTESQVFVRAAIALREAYLACRHGSFDFDLGEIYESRGETLPRLVFRQKRKPSKYHPTRGPHIEFPPTIPDDLPDADGQVTFMNEKDWELILATQECICSLHWSQVMMTWMLSGLYDVQETNVHVKKSAVAKQGQRLLSNDLRTEDEVFTCSEEELFDLRIHTLRKITLRSTDTRFALDLTNAQYGWYEPTMRWREWTQQRLRKFQRPLRRDYSVYDEFLDRSAVGTNDWSTYQSKLVETFTSHMQEYYDNRPNFWHTLSQSTENEFLVWKRDFVRLVRAAIKLAVQETGPQWLGIRLHARVARRAEEDSAWDDDYARAMDRRAARDAQAKGRQEAKARRYGEAMKRAHRMWEGKGLRSK